ncbi:ATP-binding protein [Trichocoleus sp. FACHB-262]|uniref:hybrid sensor histidine kinase/response regulator n=1 Tax=Trichocoleus sp. FACHB-262 TaxID=2692869 RepID=UPI001684F7D1|nr:ATP-binding protein [Trichocoleus sp. FACHB-262]MBD2122032.1 response regulator [Trichocoleus sp. FACHB-262]
MFESNLNQDLLMKDEDKTREQLLDEIAALRQQNHELEVLHQHTQALKQAEAERQHLLLREQAARTVAESAERRAAFLAEASRVLASSLDYEATLESVAQLAVPPIADWCLVDVLNQDGTLRRLAIAHLDATKVAQAWQLNQRYPPVTHASSGPAYAVRTRASELIPHISEEMLIAYAQNAEHLELLRSLSCQSAMVVPLIARDRVLGVITFATAESKWKYNTVDLVLAEDLAQRAAIAVDNARLYQTAQAALQEREAGLRLQQSVEQKLTLLVEASSTLISSLELTVLLPKILDLSCNLIAADAYAVWRFLPSLNKWQVVSAAGLSEAYQQSVIQVTTATPTMPDEPFVIEDVEQSPLLEMRKAGYRQEGIMALLVLPLKIHGETSGTLVFYYHQPHPFHDTEIRVGMALANLSASAIGTTELYQEQKRLRAEAEAANRIKDEFLAVLSHELRTPLNPILGWAKLLRGGKLEPAKVDLALETIERNAKLQTQLIEDLLDVSRILQGKLTLTAHPVNLVAVIAAAIETVRLAAEAKSIRIHTLFEDGVGQVLGDQNRLQQVIWNLLSNAVKFTPAGGQVEVKLEQIGSQAQIRVSDTGKGIAPEFLSYIFDYFRQADSTTTRIFGGLGLGLAIARHLVELHGGMIQAASAGEGQGATFVIRLPLWQVEERNQHELLPGDAAVLSLQPWLTTLRILLVDDDADTREVVEFILNQAGATVTAVGSAGAALQALSQAQHDLLLSDIGMPQMDGYMLIRQVRSLPPEQGGTIPAIALTAYAGELNQQQVLAAGFQQHVAKPIEPDYLIKAIAQLMGRVD